MDSVREVKMVWENLALAMALWTGTKKGLITTAHAPTGRVAVPTDNGMIVEVFNPLELRGNQDLARCISNQVRGAVTFSAMQTYGTMEQVFRRPPLKEADPRLARRPKRLVPSLQHLESRNAGAGVELPPGLSSTF